MKAKLGRRRIRLSYGDCAKKVKAVGVRVTAVRAMEAKVKVGTGGRQLGKSVAEVVKR